LLLGVVASVWPARVVKTPMLTTAALLAGSQRPLSTPKARDTYLR